MQVRVLSWAHETALEAILTRFLLLFSSVFHQPRLFRPQPTPGIDTPLRSIHFYQAIPPAAFEEISFNRKHRRGYNPKLHSYYVLKCKQINLITIYNLFTQLQTDVTQNIPFKPYRTTKNGSSGQFKPFSIDLRN